jgi:hypothetical protein
MRGAWTWPLAMALGLCACASAQEVSVVDLSAGHEGAWRFVRGEWSMAGGVLEQKRETGPSAAILTEPGFADFALTVEFNIRPVGNGVRAAALIFRATGTLTYYWLHLDSKNNQAILTRSTPGNTWVELGRKPLQLPPDVWHTAQVACRGPRIVVTVDGAEVMSAEDGAISVGRIGVGTSQGRVAFRNLTIEGERQPMGEPLADEQAPFKVISRGEAAGVYQAFPDVCRLQNGDLAVVFYAGYGHVSVPNADWPKGGRICMVRSSDEGRTWSEPAIIFDDAEDNRDPHIAQMSDGTLICSFFSLRVVEGKYQLLGVQLARSTDGGRTWSPEAEMIVPGWAVSAPVREIDGVYLLGVYYEKDGVAFGGVTRSTDRGRTWSEPIPIGKESGAYLDAETDVIRLTDGRLFAALRSSKVNMYCATSADLGLTWSPAKDIGFPGHAPHLTRLSTGEVLLTHRVPETALHVSRDDCATWQGPYNLDHVGGAYPSTVELKDGTVLAVYYEEGEGSAIRALRFRLKPDGIEPLPLD